MNARKALRALCSPDGNSLAACSVSDDLFLVPEGQGFVVYFDHDGQLILDCKDREVHDGVGEVLVGGGSAD
jgi:hypothetical protein